MDSGGLALARGFFRDCVEPVVSELVPGLRYAAGLLGPGSEVLGYDTEVSRDHHWGPRAMLFMASGDLAMYGSVLRDGLARNLPYEYGGFPTSFSAPDQADKGVQHLVVLDSGPVNHRVETLDPVVWLREYLGVEVSRNGMGVRDWLVVPHQKLRSIVGGELFRDEIGLERVREALGWYPDDVWRYVLAAGWQRISQDEHLMGRAGQVGDELGSRVIAARLVRDTMRLGFLMERVYPPYAKWFGTAFGELSCAGELYPLLSDVLDARDYGGRGEALGRAYAALARQHNRLGLTEVLSAASRPFFGRPFDVIFGERFAKALVRGIGDPEVRELCARPLIGPVDLFSDSTDLLEDGERCSALRALL